MKALMLCITVSIVCLVPRFVLAKDFWVAHAQGWHWYHDPLWITPTKPKPSPATVISHDPINTLSIVQRIAKRALDHAILHPTPDNVSYYIKIQNMINNNSSHFARVWQQVLQHNPQLDYSIMHPTNHVGKQVYLDQYHQAQAQAIHALAKHHGLFFFFRSTCPYCHRFAPIVKDFAQRYGITVVPVSLDGGTLPEFPHAKIDNGASQTFHVSVVPALFLVDPTTKNVTPVAYGLTTENVIAERLYQLTQSSRLALTSTRSVS